MAVPAHHHGRPDLLDQLLSGLARPSRASKVMKDQDPERPNLLHPGSGQLRRQWIGVAIAIDGLHRSKGRKLLQHFHAANVPSMQDQAGAAKEQSQLRIEEPVGIGYDADAKSRKLAQCFPDASFAIPDSGIR